MAWRRTGDKSLSAPMLTQFTDAYTCAALGGELNFQQGMSPFPPLPVITETKLTILVLYLIMKSQHLIWKSGTPTSSGALPSNKLQRFVYMIGYYRADSRPAPSQSETSFQSNTVSHCMARRKPRISPVLLLQGYSSPSSGYHGTCPTGIDISGLFYCGS